MAIFQAEGEEAEWHVGVIVRYDASRDDELPFTLYFQMDDTWEQVGLPDDGIVFRVSPTGMDPRQRVPPEYLPGDADDL